MDVGEDGVEAVAAVTQVPIELVETGLAWWLKRGTLRLVGGKLTMPNFLDAQEAPASDAQRMRESRARARDKAVAADAGIPVTKTNGSARIPNGTVTYGYNRSLCAVPSRTVPSRTEPTQRGEAPAAPPAPYRAVSTRGSRLPEGWEPSLAVIRRFADREHVDALASVEQFKNHWLSATTRSSTKSNWDLAFTNWVLKDIADGKAKPVASKGYVPESVSEDVGPCPPELAARLRSLKINRIDDLFASPTPFEAKK